MENVKIMGEGTIASGIYNNVSIMGEGDIVGNIKANRLSVLGNAKATDSIKTKNLKVSGNFKSEKIVNVSETLKVLGDATFSNHVESNVIRISGDAMFKKGLSGKEIKILGKFDVFGDCESEHVVGKGETNINGLLSADNIKLKLSNHSVINEIGGENIKVCKGKNLFMFRGRRGRLVSNVIEGDNIELANTICKVVRGNNIVIKSGCKIALIEYTNSLEIKGNSEIGEKIWRKN